MLKIKLIYPAIVSGLILTIFSVIPAQAQRRHGNMQIERANNGRELNQRPSRQFNQPQPTPRYETSRPASSPPGKPFHRPKPSGTSANDEVILPGKVTPSRSENNYSPRPKHNDNKNYSVVKNEPSDLSKPVQNNNQPSATNPAPKPKRNSGANNGGGGAFSQNSHSNIHIINRPDVNQVSSSHWTHQPRQLSRDDYRRAPLAYRYHYSGTRGYYNAHNPCWRYNFLPRYYSVIHDFYYPYSTLYWGGMGYRYCSGVFYMPFGAGFRVVPPPFGIFIDILPMGFETVYGFNSPYYYYNGAYYEDYNNSYRVIAPPLGAIVESIPDGYETITIDGETYYKVNNVQYKPVVKDNGEIWYQVIKVD